MYVLTSDEMRALDEKTIREIGIPSRVLMERAGVSVVLSMEHEFGSLENLDFVVLVGGGNNGGDGLVVARSLLDYTPNVLAILIKEDLKGDALENFKAYKKIGGEYAVLGKDMDLEEVEYVLMSTDVVVDAMLGIGIKGEVREPISSIIDMVNQSPARKVCVDIPSGVDSDTGKIMGKAVRCDLTVTFAYPKIGHVLYPGREYTGRLKVASIGIPRVLADGKRAITTEDFARSLIPLRRKDSNKGNYGRVGIIGGSILYSGAPVLSALGSMKSGSGLTYVFTPKEVHAVVTSNYPEAISIPVESCGGYLCERSFDGLKEWIGKMDVLAIGPGMALNEDTVGFLKRVIGVEKPIVLDADGLNALSSIGTEVLKSRKSPTVLTPHPGEFSRLLGKSVQEVLYNYRLAEDFARDNGVVLVLKGSTTIVTDGEHTLFNLTGNTGLSKGGSGDVLTGVIASLVAQKLDPLEAAVLGVYVHGAAAHLNKTDESGLLPTELAGLIPDVLKSLKKRQLLA